MKYQTSDEIIKEAKETLLKSPFASKEYESYYVIGYLAQKYDSLLQSISEETKDKFISSSDDPTYEEIIEEHENYKEEESDLPAWANDIIKSHFNIKTT